MRKTPISYYLLYKILLPLLLVGVVAKTFSSIFFAENCDHNIDPRVTSGQCYFLKSKQIGKFCFFAT
jgi:hypothetical protein